MWRQRFILIGWCLLGVLIIMLFTMAMKQKEHRSCSGISIEISGNLNRVFIDEKTIMEQVKTDGAEEGKDISLINLRNMEKDLKTNSWIKNADVFFDNNQLLHIRIDEREPLARIMTLQGDSFYIDSSGLRLPLSDQEVAEVPVFTSFTSDKKILSAPDSSLLNDIKKIAQFIQSDSFWMAQIQQINITPQRTFEMVPLLGNQLIELGSADSLQNKFNNLYSFYKQVWSKYGFEKYEEIDLQYDGQVVAVKRGVAKPLTDSSKAASVFDNSKLKLNSLMNDTTFAAPEANIFEDSVMVNKKMKGVKIHSAERSGIKKPGNKNLMMKGNKPKAVLKKHL